jgi:FMNH2-dependent dimethyl sulfone monooxygenase
MAKLGASTDRISGGRFCITLVNGTRPQEHNMYGKWVESDGGRYKQMQEFIQVMKGLWTEDTLTYNGDFYKIDGVKMPTGSVRAPLSTRRAVQMKA